MEFVHPEYLWLLGAVPVLALLWWVGLWHHQRMRSRFGNIANLEKISRISWSGRGWFRGALYVVTFNCMVLGLASPQIVTRELRPVPMPTDLVFLLDISPSMYARDMDPSRLGRAEQIIQKFIISKQEEDRYALVAFNFNAVPLAYLTRDPESILLYFDYLNQQNEPVLGSNMGAAIISALRVISVDEQVNPEYAKGRRRLMVILSDGDDNAGQLAGPLQFVAGTGMKIYTFGLGSANGAYVPVEMFGGVDGEVVKYLTTVGGGGADYQPRRRRNHAHYRGTNAGEFFPG